jgi:hypothetical protein
MPRRLSSLSAVSQHGNGFIVQGFAESDGTFNGATGLAGLCSGID